MLLWKTVEHRSSLGIGKTPWDGKAEFRKQKTEFLSILRFRPEHRDEDEDRIKAGSVHMKPLNHEASGMPR